MNKVVTKILQSSLAMPTGIHGLTIHHAVANFLQCVCAKNYNSCLATDKVMAEIDG